VRDYLVTRGVAADRVTAQGFGSSRSIADNKSAEGRANNRRVEIVVAPTGPKM
jgi:outer membrane protein OmpA-like peptidoglycan-associated protein